MSEFKVGDRVMHSDLDLRNGWYSNDPDGVGTIIEIDRVTGYLRVEWDENPYYEGHWFHNAHELEAV